MMLAMEDFEQIVSALQPPIQEPATSKPDSDVPAEERRHAVRVDVAATIQGWVVEKGKLGEGFSASVQNISLVGMELLPSISLAPGREVILALPKLGATPLYICGLANRRTTGAGGQVRCGIEFSSMAPDAAIETIKRRPVTSCPANS